MEKHPYRRKLLNVCIAYTEVDVELRRINDARRAARLAKRVQSTSDAPSGAEGCERSSGGPPVGNQSTPIEQPVGNQ
ncbi:MAG: hypothetical protein HC793_01140 [Aquincola sp.]|nr:hypothetical protein [Aquincola sp.]